MRAGSVKVCCRESEAHVHNGECLGVVVVVVVSELWVNTRAEFVLMSELRMSFTYVGECEGWVSHGELPVDEYEGSVCNSEGATEEFYS